MAKKKTEAWSEWATKTAASWAAESSRVIRSYLDALVSCVERRPRPSGASRRWSSEASASIELR